MLDVLGEVVPTRQAGADLGRGGVRPAEPDPDVPHDAARVRGDGLRPVHRAGAAEPLPRGPLRPRARSGGASSARSTGCRRPARAAVRRQALRRRCTGSDPAQALRLLGLPDHPGRGAPADPVRDAERGAVHRRSAILPGILLLTAFTMVGPVIQSVVPYRLRGMGVGARLGLRLLRRAPPAARCSPRSSPTRSGPRAAVLLVGIPSTLVGGLLIVRSASSHQERPVAGRRRAARGARGAPAPEAPTPSTIPAIQVDAHRLLLRPGAGPVRRRLRGAPRRGARAARHERRRASRRSCASSPGSARRRAASSGCTARRSPTSRPSSG